MIQRGFDRGFDIDRWRQYRIARERQFGHRPGRVWLTEVGLFALVLVEAFLPLRVFDVQMDFATAATMAASLAAGCALLRGLYALAVRALPFRWQNWAFLAPALLGLAIVSVGGLLHGPRHYALSTTIAFGFLFTTSVFYLFGPGRPHRWRLVGRGLCFALYLLLLLLVDLNVLSLYPRHVSVFSLLLASTCLFTTLTLVPLPAPRVVSRSLAAGAVVAFLLLALAPAHSARVAGYLRRQAEFGALLSPAVWVRASRPTPYLIRSSEECPAPVVSAVTIEGTARTRNVLFISIDTLRHDFFLSSGQPLADVAPNLAALAAEGCSYTNVRSVGAATHMVMPAMYNATFAWRAIQQPLLSTLAQRAGLEGRAYGGLQNIGHYTGLPEEMNFSETPLTDRILRDIADKSDRHQPWMTVAHYLDLHLPRKMDLLAKFGRDLRPLYLEKLTAVDAEIGRLFRAIKSRGEWDRTIVVITADHGEELNERGYSEHAFHLYETVLRVPLIARLPGKACRDRQTPISVLDIVPLVADGLGLRVSSPALNGQWPPNARASHYGYSTQGGPFLSVQDNDRKIIVDGRYGDVEVYDLATDPEEKRDLALGLTAEVAERLATIPIPWEPLTPTDQRYRRANGTAMDLCPSPARSSIAATELPSPAR